jgi:hypothetical protein
MRSAELAELVMATVLRVRDGVVVFSHVDFWMEVFGTAANFVLA